jgi:predicted RNA-binding protein YlqC (UPF0109 family)
MKTDPQPFLSLLRRLVSEMVAYPGDVVIDHRTMAASITVTIQAHAADTPRLIGSQAQNYSAISAIAVAIGAKAGYRVHVPPIREPVVGQPERFRFASRPDWPREKLIKLVRDTMDAMFLHPSSIVYDEAEDPDGLMTTLDVVVSAQEREVLARELAGPVRKLFDAIGRANGRLLAVDLVQDTEVQPATAAGRHAKQIP